jgi:uncharacterized membrane protein
MKYVIYGMALLFSAYSAYNAKYGFSGPEFMASLLFWGLIALIVVRSLKKKPTID